MYQVVVGGMVNYPKESFELAGIPMHQDEVCDHVLNDLLSTASSAMTHNYVFTNYPPDRLPVLPNGRQGRAGCAYFPLAG